MAGRALAPLAVLAILLGPAHAGPASCPITTSEPTATVGPVYVVQDPLDRGGMYPPLLLVYRETGLFAGLQRNDHAHTNTCGAPEFADHLVFDPLRDHA